MNQEDAAPSFVMSWRNGYNRTLFKGDLVAGLTVGIVLIPQGMAYALLAGAPPVYGLYASLVPLVMYALLGSTRQLAVGIVAIDSLIVAASIAVLAPAGSEDYLSYALLLALMVGCIQLVMGLLRFGFVVNLLSRPVITGFTAGVALIIGMSQLQHLTGVPLGRNMNVFSLLAEAFNRLTELHLLTLLIGVTGIVLLWALKKWAPRVPAPIVLVVASALVVFFGRLDLQGVAIVGDIPAGLPRPSMPVWSYEAIQRLFPTAITLSLIQFMGVVSLGKMLGSKHGYRVQANKELVALGAMNITGSAFQSLPVSVSYSRSAVNDRAGAQTPFSNAIAALLILCTLLFLTPFFYYLPIPIFASIIMVAAFGLVNVAEVKFLLRTKAIDGVIALLTFFVTLTLGIEHGILTGIGFSVIAIMYRISRPNIAILGHLPHSRSFRDVNNHKEAHQFEGVTLIRIDASFSFANADLLQDAILDHAMASGARAIILDASSVNDLDTTGLATLIEVSRIVREKNILFYVASLRQKSLDMLALCGAKGTIGEDCFFLTTHRALLNVLSAWGRQDEYLNRL